MTEKTSDKKPENREKFPEKFLIKGLGGRRVLKGEISVSGMKNAALPLMAASVLIKGKSRFTNVPDIEDVKSTSELIDGLGGGVSKTDHHSFLIDASKISKTKLDPEIAKRFRGSVIFTGPLLARFGKVSFPHPGGCVLGARPIDMFLSGFEKMGVKAVLKNEIYELFAPKGLHGVSYFFKIPTVTGTETLMMAATLAKGKTILKNCALEPEVENLADFLVSCGAKIKGAGTQTIEIEGVKELQEPSSDCAVIPDRIEAGSFLVLASLLGKDVKVTNCNPEHLDAILERLKEAGVPLILGKDFIRVKIDSKKQKSFKSVDIKTHEYPGFPTDLQAPFAVFLTQTEGEGLVFETIFEGRLNYIQDLIRMHADIKQWDAHHISIKGKTTLSGKELVGPDIRAGLAYLLAAIVADGDSVINNAYIIDRGYEKIEKRLQKIGVSIERVK